MSNLQRYVNDRRADEAQRDMNSCDTMVALPGSTAGGQTIFAKNSDRPADECQPLVLRPAATHASGSVANCQFVDVEQSPVTYRHVGSRPWWCYGYEHGFNEHQVVIGNESLPSRLGHAPDARLVGMEVLRLALERARTAGRPSRSSPGWSAGTVRANSTTPKESGPTTISISWPTLARPTSSRRCVSSGP